MSEEIKQAETYLELWAICPHCDEHQAVEWCDETVDGKESHVCERCREEFTYVHPENNYGLAV